MFEEIKKILLQSLPQDLVDDELLAAMEKINPKQPFLPNSIISKFKFVLEMTKTAANNETYLKKYEKLPEELKKYTYIISPEVINNPLNFIDFIGEKFNKIVREFMNEAMNLIDETERLNENISNIIYKINRKSTLGENIVQEEIELNELNIKLAEVEEKYNFFMQENPFNKILIDLLKDIEMYEVQQNLSFEMVSELSFYFLPLIYSFNEFINSHEEFGLYKEDLNEIIKLIKLQIKSLLAEEDASYESEFQFRLTQMVTRWEIHLDNIINKLDLDKIHQKSPEISDKFKIIKNSTEQINRNFLKNLQDINLKVQGKEGNAAKQRNYIERLKKEHKELFEMWQSGQWPDKAKCARAYNDKLIDSGRYQTDEEGAKEERKLYEALLKYGNAKNI